VRSGPNKKTKVVEYESELRVSTQTTKPHFHHRKAEEKKLGEQSRRTEVAALLDSK
jgi:hypothetical protein